MSANIPPGALNRRCAGDRTPGALNRRCAGDRGM